ncbi:fasciclin domain-containing protein [Mycolicibacterium madagascariense]|nr:fasciclin domain-containing protein [Mycolicibacterium madagascariense]MCV7013676.1 fasciclin domain-containing protein [Mycolicibacterium madagascariense]
MKSTHRALAAAGLTAVAVLGTSACSSDTASQTASGVSSSASSISSSVLSSSSSAPAMTGAADPAADLVGSGCAGYAQKVPEGPGSVTGMAQDPVATAASNNPLLTTLTSAVSGKLNPGVNLVDTLNGGQFTVLAPTDDAFAKIDSATLDKLKTDAPLLKGILTYHVIPGQLSPAQVVGTHKTVQGDDVTVTGSGEGLKFNQAGLVCGGVHTANATVYMIDTVLMPPAK